MSDPITGTTPSSARPTEEAGVPEAGTAETLRSVDSTEPTPTASATPKSPTRRRREVELLRAVAVVLVAGHHVLTGRVSGGVDVFLVLSALVLTLSFLHRVGPDGQGRGWSVPSTIVARLRRLLPMMSVVLLSVLAAAAVLIPPVRWRSMFDQAIASITFRQNFALADLAVDYYASNRAQAPVLQHFWSLAIQGQVFVLWPLLFLGVLLVARRVRRPVLRPLLAAVMLAVLAWSQHVSVVATAADPTRAYFLTAPRLWEFAVGSLLALGLVAVGDLTRRADGRTTGGPGWLAPVTGWLGLVALVACGFLQPEGARFPGVLSWWPVGAAALVVLAGEAGRWGPTRVLDNRVTRWLSANAYGLYLWHWPVLVLWLETAERPRATLVDAAGIVALALLLTWASAHLVRIALATLKPGASRIRRGVVVAASIGLVLVPVFGWEAAVNQRAATVAAQPVEDNPGARVLRPGYAGTASPTAAVKPYATDVEGEWANLPDRCDPATRPAGLNGENCLEYRPAGEPTRTIVVLGDSRSAQWTAALQPLAEQRGWRVISIVLFGCAYSGPRVDGAAICEEFNAESLRWTLALHPDAVLSVATRTSEVPSEPERLEEAYLAGVQPFLDAGVQVVGLRDTPRFEFDVPACVQRYGLGSERCALPRSTALAEVDPLKEINPKPAGWGGIDMNRRVCPGDVCEPVVGNVYVYMDKQHLSKTYVESMAEDFARSWFRATGWPQG